MGSEPAVADGVSDVGFADEVHLRQPVSGLSAAPARSGAVAPLVALLVVGFAATSLLPAWPALLRGLEPDLSSAAGLVAFLALVVAFPAGAAVLCVPRIRAVSGMVAASSVLAAAGVAMALDPADGTAGFGWLVLFRLVQGAAAAVLLSAVGLRLGGAAGPSRISASAAATVGGLLGLVLGGALAVGSWRATVFASAVLALVAALIVRSGSDVAPAPSRWSAGPAGSRSGVVTAFLAALARGGLPLVLVFWLQCVWLPLHDVDPGRAPLLAALGLIPLGLGVLIAAPLSAALVAAGVRWLAPAGLVVAAAALLLLALLPVNFAMTSFVVILLLAGVGFGLAATPVRAAAVGREGRGGGLLAAQTCGVVVSVLLLGGLLVAGISPSLDDALRSRLGTAGAVSAPGALSATAAGTSPFSGPSDDTVTLSADEAALLNDPGLLPGILAEPFDDGLSIALGTAAVACLVAALCSVVAVRGRSAAPAAAATTPMPVAPGPAPVGPAAPASVSPEPPAGAVEPIDEPPSEPPSDPQPVVAAPVSEDRYRLAGVVRLDDGAPVDAVVTVTDLDGAELARTTADAQGSFEVVLPEPGHRLLVLSGPRIVSSAVLADVGSDEAPLDLTVRSSGGILHGRLGSAGGPVAGGVVVLTTDGRLRARTTTGTDGTFALADVPAGVHVLTAAAPDGDPRSRLVRMTRLGQVRVDVTVPLGQQAGGTSSRSS